MNYVTFGLFFWNFKLYKLKKGKKEEYVLTDDELNNLILSNAVKGTEVRAKNKRKGIEGDGQ